MARLKDETFVPNEEHRPVYDDLMAEQLQVAEEKQGKGDLAALLHSGETWVVS